ncbi:uncharacterized protein C8Q71DRAFT_724251 [Rhodofomes roseus]|uniref:GRF-type domain-containing protein n=1 Tax=Rhodofomes roseus TaxID=34475 RepID=A0ABQ8KEG5_9APHY|nr:uncharacterized protein C8Q71DRAFT_724251 [Rhodofomes roseus]KAH9835604.1 hypothetical protein C8Q71DRAFT_724251 [Rhodofomes roseus]
MASALLPAVSWQSSTSAVTRRAPASHTRDTSQCGSMEPTPEQAAELYTAPRTVDWACSTCGCSLEIRLTRSNEKGNRGRSYVSCREPASQSKPSPCNFFRWVTSRIHPTPHSRAGSSGTESTIMDARSAGEPSSVRPNPTSTVSVQSASTQSSSQPAGSANPQQHCSHTSGAKQCTSRRIRKDCRRRMCRKHCCASGGCVAPDHAGAKPIEAYMPNADSPSAGSPGALAVTISPAMPGSSGSLLPTSRSAPVIADEVRTALTATQPAMSSRPRPSQPLQASLPTVVGGDNAEPRHASQMLPMVTETYLREQQALQQRREQDAQRLEARRLARQYITVFAWVQNADVEVFILQEELVWPHLKLTHTVLCDLGFKNEDDEKLCRVKMYQKSLGVWSVVKQDQVFAVDEEEKVFVKALDVADPPQFAELLSAATRTKEPHLHKNIAYERASIREQSHAAIIKANPPLRQRHAPSRSQSVLSHNSDTGPIIYANPLLRPRHAPSRSQSVLSHDSDTGALPATTDSQTQSHKRQHSDRPVPTQRKRRPLIKQEVADAIDLTVEHSSDSATAASGSASGSPWDPIAIEFSDDDMTATAGSTLLGASGNSLGSTTTSKSKGKARESRRRSHSVLSISDSDDDEPLSAGRPGESSANDESSSGGSKPRKERPLDIARRKSGEPIRWLTPSIQQWPRDYYATDIVDGFEAIDAAVATRTNTVAGAFEAHFKIKYAHGTYYEHRKRWNNAPPDVKNKLLKAGRTGLGLWSTFMNAVRAPNAEVKAARKRERASRRAAPLRIPAGFESISTGVDRSHAIGPTASNNMFSVAGKNATNAFTRKPSMHNIQCLSQTLPRGISSTTTQGHGSAQDHGHGHGADVDDGEQLASPGLTFSPRTPATLSPATPFGGFSGFHAAESYEGSGMVGVMEKGHHGFAMGHHQEMGAHAKEEAKKMEERAERD